jgi:hypothetical protein
MNNQLKTTINEASTVLTGTKNPHLIILMAFILKAESGETSYFYERAGLETKIDFSQTLFANQFAVFWSGLDIDQLSDTQIRKVMKLFNTYEFCELKGANDLPDLHEYLTGETTVPDAIYKINEFLKINARFLRKRMTKSARRKNKKRISFMQEALSQGRYGSDFKFLETVI